MKNPDPSILNDSVYNYHKSNDIAICFERLPFVLQGNKLIYGTLLSSMRELLLDYLNTKRIKHVEQIQNMALVDSIDSSISELCRFVGYSIADNLKKLICKPQKTEIDIQMIEVFDKLRYLKSNLSEDKYIGNNYS